MLTQAEAIELFEYKNGHLYYKTDSDLHHKTTGKRFGAVQKDGYLRGTIRKKKLSVHRLIFLMHHGYLPQKIDHKDCNRANNHIENLREATTQENGFNRKLNVDNTSGIKGIFWSKKSKKWQAQFKVSGKHVYVGLFENLEDAKTASFKARKKYHGEFTRI